MHNLVFISVAERAGTYARATCSSDGVCVRVPPTANIVTWTHHTLYASSIFHFECAHVCDGMNKMLIFLHLYQLSFVLCVCSCRCIAFEFVKKVNFHVARCSVLTGFTDSLSFDAASNVLICVCRIVNDYNVEKIKQSVHICMDVSSQSRQMCAQEW